MGPKINQLHKKTKLNPRNLLDCLILMLLDYESRCLIKFSFLLVTN